MAAVSLALPVLPVGYHVGSDILRMSYSRELGVLHSAVLQPAIATEESWSCAEQADAGWSGWGHMLKDPSRQCIMQAAITVAAILFSP